MVEQAIYGVPALNGQPGAEARVLAHSPGWPPEAVAALIDRIALTPMPADDEAGSQACALLTQPDGSVIVGCAHYRQGDPKQPVFHCANLSEPLPDVLANDLRGLFKLVSLKPAPDDGVLPALEEPVPVRWTMDREVAVLQRALGSVDGDLNRLMTLLDGMVGDHGLAIRHFPGQLDARLNLVQALLLLLPRSVRTFISFSTHAEALPHQEPHLIFSDADQSGERRIADWLSWQAEQTISTDYPIYLRELWDGDLSSLLRLVQAIDRPTLQTASEPISQSLARMVRRHRIDMAVMHDEFVPTDDLITVLTRQNKLEHSLRERYHAALLKNAFDERHQEAALLVAQAVDKDPSLRSALQPLIDAALADQPDALYFFVRTRLAAGVDARWLEWLHRAAIAAVSVAVDSGDPETLQSWLRLIAREPESYQLGGVLGESILAAQVRAREHAGLARTLLVLTIKHDARLVDALVDDDALIEQLTPEMQGALQNYDMALITNLPSQSQEIFLLALQRALTRGQIAITLGALDVLWQIYQAEKQACIAEAYRPLNIIASLARHNETCLSSESLAHLLNHLLEEGQEPVLMKVVQLMAERPGLRDQLAAALNQSRRSVSSILNLVGDLINAGIMPPEQAFETYISIMDMRTWDADSIELAEQASRLLQQYPDISPASSSLWQLLATGAENRSELITRVTLRRLTASLSEFEAGEELTQILIQLRKLSVWSSSARNQLMAWWRAQIRQRSLIRLQQIDRVLEGQRTLEDLRAVAQTTIALRKMIGQHSLEDLAHQFAVAYSVLESLSDVFDNGGRGHVVIDPETIRNELDARAVEMSAESRHIMATNLKELAQIIITMADNRSKPSLMRSDETLERQLVTGEHAPQGSIDLMKWLSGYLDGLQGPADSE